MTFHSTISNNTSSTCICTRTHYLWHTNDRLLFQRELYRMRATWNVSTSTNTPILIPIRNKPFFEHTFISSLHKSFSQPLFGSEPRTINTRFEHFFLYPRRCLFIYLCPYLSLFLFFIIPPTPACKYAIFMFWGFHSTHVFVPSIIVW